MTSTTTSAAAMNNSNSSVALPNGTAAALAHNTGTSSIEDAIAAMKAGKFVVVMDNEDRENEGDLIMAAEFATEESVAFMLRHTTGIICVPALAARIDALQLPLMVENNTEVHKCKFTVTVDLRDGNSTGVSAADRARTIRALADPNITASAFNRPGHIFPLLAMDGGVLVRAGHTEAATDLARLAGAAMSVGYICEMNDDNGRMMRRPALEAFAATYDLPLITISDLIRYRVRTEELVTRSKHQRESVVSTPLGAFTAYEYASTVSEGQLYDVLVCGDVAAASGAPVPVHFVDDGFAASVTAQWAQHFIVQHGAGVLIYVNDSAKLLAISGELMARQSIFGVGMQIVKDLGVANVTLLTTDAAVPFDMRGFGIDVTGVTHLTIPSSTTKATAT